MIRSLKAGNRTCVFLLQPHGSLRRRTVGLFHAERREMNWVVWNLAWGAVLVWTVAAALVYVWTRS